MRRPSRRARPCRRRRRSRRTSSLSVTFSTCSPVVVRLGVAAARLLHARERRAQLRAPLSTSSSRLWIALWLVEATPTVLPAAIRRAISRPDVHVLPEPGGPWMTRCRPSSEQHERLSSRRGRSSARRGRTARGAGSTRAPGSGRRRRAASGRAARARPPARSCGTAPPGSARRGSGTSSSVGPRLSTSVARVAVELDDLAGAVAASPGRRRPGPARACAPAAGT